MIHEWERGSQIKSVRGCQEPTWWWCGLKEPTPPAAVTFTKLVSHTDVKVSRWFHWNRTINIDIYKPVDTAQPCSVYLSHTEKRRVSFTSITVWQQVCKISVGHLTFRWRVNVQKQSCGEMLPTHSWDSCWTPLVGWCKPLYLDSNRTAR